MNIIGIKELNTRIVNKLKEVIDFDTHGIISLKLELSMDDIPKLTIESNVKEASK